jgi:hypothetical protein
MLATVLFVQGAGDMHHPEGSIHLARYLERELGDRFRVLAPEMPEADTNPRYQPWRDAIVRELEVIDGPVLIVGHSFGGSVVLKMLAESPAPTAIRAVFLASMPWWGPDGWDVPEYALADDFAAHLPDIPIVLYHSVGDPEVSVDQLALYESRLPDAQVRRVPGAQHSFVDGLPVLVNDIRAMAVSGHRIVPGSRLQG